MISCNKVARHWIKLIEGMFIYVQHHFNSYRILSIFQPGWKYELEKIETKSFGWVYFKIETPKVQTNKFCKTPKCLIKYSWRCTKFTLKSALLCENCLLMFQNVTDWEFWKWRFNGHTNYQRLVGLFIFTSTNRNSTPLWISREPQTVRLWTVHCCVNYL